MVSVADMIGDAVDCHRAGDLDLSEELRALVGRQGLGVKK